MTTLLAIVIGAALGMAYVWIYRSLGWIKQERPMSEQKKASAMFRRNSARVKEGTR